MIKSIKVGSRYNMDLISNASCFSFPSSCSQSSGHSETWARWAATPSAEPEVYSSRCGEDQQREERAPADHHYPQQVSWRCWTAQVEWGDCLCQIERQGAVSSFYAHLAIWFNLFPRLSYFCPFYFLQSQAELKLAEYHKLARKLKLIPVSAENACGHDFEIRPFEYGPGSMVQHKTQIQVLQAHAPVLVNSICRYFYWRQLWNWMLLLWVKIDFVVLYACSYQCCLL